MKTLALVSFLSLASLAACSPGASVTSPVAAPVTSSTAASYLQTAENVVSSGQLVCQVGPTAFQMLVPGGAAILAKGATSTAVAKVCAGVNGVATALSDVSVTPAGITVQLPPSITIPTKAIS